jgi:hypothetical protein
MMRPLCKATRPPRDNHLPPPSLLTLDQVVHVLERPRLLTVPENREVLAAQSLQGAGGWGRARAGAGCVWACAGGMHGACLAPSHACLCRPKTDNVALPLAPLGPSPLTCATKFDTTRPSSSAILGP